MLSALIPSAGRKPAVPLAGQLAHESCVRPGPLVLGTAPFKSPTPTTDRDRHCCYRRPVLTGRGPGHFLFCLALHVAMQVGPYLHHSSRGVRHMVSEDSGCLSVHSSVAASAVHGESHLSKGFEALHQSDARLPSWPARCGRRSTNSCCLELRRGCVSKKGITLLRRSSLFRTTNTRQVSPCRRWFSCIRPQPKPELDQVEDLTPLGVLTDVELRHELPTDSCTRVPLDGDVE